MEIDHEILSMVILLSAYSKRDVVSYKQKYVHKVLVVCVLSTGQLLSQASHGKTVCRSTDCLDKTIAVD